MNNLKSKFDSIRSRFGEILDETESDVEPSSLHLNMIELDCLCLLAMRDVQNWKFDIASYRTLTEDIDYYSEKLSRHRRVLKSLMDFRTMELYSFFFERFCVEHVEKAIFSFWNPGSRDKECVEFLTQFGEVLNLDSFIDFKIVPPLKLALAEWSVKEPIDKISFIKLWIDSELVNDEEIIVILFEKIQEVFETSTWAISDSSPRYFLTLLSDLSSTLVELVINLIIFPRLSSYWNSELRINPKEQTLEPFMAVVEWRDLIHDSSLLELLEEFFFPRFLNSLSTWLDMLDVRNEVARKLAQEEVARWYEGWKDLFAAHDMLYPDLVIQFNRALHLIALKFISK
jgi:hypothetical protein